MFEIDDSRKILEAGKQAGLRSAISRPQSIFSLPVQMSVRMVSPQLARLAPICCFVNDSINFRRNYLANYV